MGTNSEDESDDEMPPIIITREEWKARKPKSSKTLSGPVPDVVYTETDTRECKNAEDCSRLLRDIQSYHMDVRGLPDIQHHFMVSSDGTIYEGRGWDAHGPIYTKSDPMPQHLTGRSIEVAFIGKYKDKVPPDVMIKSSQQLIRMGMNMSKIIERKPDEKTDDDEEEEPNDEISEKDLKDIIRSRRKNQETL